MICMLVIEREWGMNSLQILNVDIEISIYTSIWIKNKNVCEMK